MKYIRLATVGFLVVLVMGTMAGGSKATESQWRFVAKAVADDAAAGDWFGFRVAVSGDTIVVGAPRDGQRDRFYGSGSVYVFVRQGDELVQQAKLTAKDAAPGDQFGGSVAISGDILVVGAESAAAPSRYCPLRI